MSDIINYSFPKWNSTQINLGRGNYRTFPLGKYALWNLLHMLCCFPCFITFDLFCFRVECLYVCSGHSLNTQQEKVRTSVTPLPMARLNKAHWHNGRRGNFALQFLHIMSHLEHSGWWKKMRVQRRILTWNARGINTQMAFRKERVFDEWSLWVTLFQSPQNCAHAAPSKSINSLTFGLFKNINLIGFIGSVV